MSKPDTLDLYTYINIATGVSNICLFYPLGRLADKVTPKIIMPLTGILCCLLSASIIFIQDPYSPISYVVFCLQSVAYLFQSIGLEGYFSKNIPKEVRGVLIGFLGFCGLIGRSIILKLGGILFEEGKALPFVALAIANVALVLFLLITMFLGIFGRTAPTLQSIRKRKMREKSKAVDM